MSDDPLMTRREAAEYLRTPARTLDEWALKGTGPRYARVGRRTLYRKSDVDAWFNERLTAKSA